MKKTRIKENIDVTEIADYLYRLEALNDNLFLIRAACRNDDYLYSPEMIDGALWIINDEITTILEKMDDLINQTIED